MYKILELEKPGQSGVLCYFVAACIKQKMRDVGQKSLMHYFPTNTFVENLTFFPTHF